MILEILKKRVSLPIYFSFYSVSCAIGTWYWLNYTNDEIVVFAGFMVIVALNHLLLVIGLSSLLDALKSYEKPSIGRILFSLLGKTVLLAGGFFMILRFAKDNIYMTLILYIFQLIILFISIKKVE